MNTVDIKTITYALTDEGRNIEVECVKVTHKSAFGFTVLTMSARSKDGPLTGIHAENALYIAFDYDLRGTTDQEFFPYYYANCPTCHATTEYTLDELSRNNPNAPIIHSSGGHHHIGELMSDGSYE